MRRLVDVEHLLETSGSNFAYAPQSREVYVRMQGFCMIPTTKWAGIEDRSSTAYFELDSTELLRSFSLLAQLTLTF